MLDPQTANDTSNQHPAITSDDKPFKDSGKETSKVNAPIVSIAPASADSADAGNQLEHDDWTQQPKQERYKHLIIDNAADAAFSVENKSGYPFEDLKAGQGLFIATRPGNTTDKLMAKLNKTIYHLRQRYSEPELSENGDTILNQVTVEIKKRNEDGTIQLDNGNIVKGANFEQKELRTPWRNYVVKPVVKDQNIGNETKAPHDGVIVIRVL